MTRRSTILLLALSGLFACTVLSSAQDFRIESQIFVGKQKKPMAESVTVFTSGLIYDFPLTGPEEIVVFDPARGRFVLLDVARKTKTTLTTQELVQFTAAMKVHASELEGAFGFAANPNFEVHFDSEQHRLTLDSKLLSYDVTGVEPKQPEAVKDYRIFADWYARLNSTRPGNLPPFARIELNRNLSENGLIPKDVELTVSSKIGLLSRTLTVRSHHLANWTLSGKDRDRVKLAGTYMAEFDAVPFKEYRQAIQVAARD